MSLKDRRKMVQQRIAKVRAESERAERELQKGKRYSQPVIRTSKDILGASELLNREELLFGFDAEYAPYLVVAEDWRLKYFEVLVFFGVLFVVISYPLRLGFSFVVPRWYKLLEYSVDSIFVIDIVLQFFISFESESTHFYIPSPRKLAILYLRSWFVVDLVSTLPFELLFDSAKWRFLRVLRGLFLLRRRRRWSSLGMNSMASSTRKQTAYLLWLFLIFILFIHWFSCLFGAIGLHSEKRGKANWMTAQDVTAENGAVRFMTALYWAAGTVTKVGYGDVVPTNDLERVVSVLLLVLSSFFYGVIWGNVNLMIRVMNGDQTNYRVSAQNTKHYMVELGVPMSWQLKVRQYAIYIWGKHHGKSSTEQFQNVPGRVQSEIATTSHFKMLSKTCFFAVLPKNNQERSTNKIAQRLQFTVSLPSHWVYAHQQRAERIYFIARGQVAVYNAPKLRSSNNLTLCVLEPGAYFGEIPLFLQRAEDDENEKIEDGAGNRTHSQSMKALSFVDLWFITYSEFEPILKMKHFAKIDILMQRIVEMRSKMMKQRRPYDDHFECNKIALQYQGEIAREQREREKDPLQPRRGDDELSVTPETASRTRTESGDSLALGFGGENDDHFSNELIEGLQRFSAQMEEVGQRMERIDRKFNAKESTLRTLQSERAKAMRFD